MAKTETLEYKVKKVLNELMFRMDMIPVSIALAQAAKKVGGEHQDLLEGNAIFGHDWDDKE